LIQPASGMSVSISYKQRNSLANILGRARYVVVQNCGHLRRDTVALLKQFLKSKRTLLNR